MNSQKRAVAVIGACIFLIGAYFIFQSYSFEKTALRAEGVIVGYADEIDECSEVVRFVSSNGKEVEFLNVGSELSTNAPTQWVASNQCSLFEDLFSAHGDVSVLYQPDDPQDAVIDRFLSRWMLSVSLLLIGALTIAAAVFGGSASSASKTESVVS